MTERTDDWRNIFTDLTDDSGCYEIDKVNIYKLASHLKALYFKIEELENDVERLKSYTWEKMTETDISKVLIEGEYATIMGVKYKRVEEPKPTILYDIIADWWDEIFINGNPSGQNFGSLVDTIESEWLPELDDGGDRYSCGWNDCVEKLKLRLRG